MRSYSQYCSIAKALDVVGDRWNLLIVRELLLRGRCRYTDLLDGLPGIATNLLADRLRDLEQAGIVAREDAPPPIATTLFGLTGRGVELGPVLHELGRWGAPLMREPAEEDAFRSHWLALPVEMFLADCAPGEPPVTIEVCTGDRPTTIETVDGRVRARQGAADAPDLVLSGAPRLIIGLLSGRLSIAAARREGLACTGDVKALRRVQARQPELSERSKTPLATA
jgi:DNA-binding HxlR family transcriptional regulator